MGKLIKIKLIELGKKQVDLCRALEKRGLHVAQCEVSNSINGNLNSPKGKRIRKECLYILDEWEKGART